MKTAARFQVSEVRFLCQRLARERTLGTLELRVRSESVPHPACSFSPPILPSLLRTPAMRSFALLFALCLLFPALAQAQSSPTLVEPNNTTGTPPFGSFGGQNENINLATGNVNITVPLFSFSARGMGLSVNATYDSKIWHPTHRFDEHSGFEIWDWDTQPVGGIPLGFGWRLGVPALSSSNHIQSSILVYDHFVVTLPDGSRHSFPKVTTAASGPLVGDSNDGTVFRIDVNSTADIVVHSPDGMEIHFASPSAQYPARMVDRNGNKILFNSSAGQLSSISDAAGRTAATFSYFSPFATSMTVTDSAGGLRTYSFVQQNLTKQSVTFASPNKTVNASGYYLTSLTAPTNQSYTFEYNDYGELVKVTYPTGGYSRYAYGTYTARHYYEDISEQPADFREVTARYLSPDGVTEHATTYTPTINSATDYNNVQMTISDPLLNRSDHFFTNQLSSNILDPGPLPPRESKAVLYDGSFTQVVQKDRTFATLRAGFPTSETTTLLDKGIKNKVEWDYEQYIAPGETGSSRDPNVIEKRDWDFIPSASAFSAAPLRKTVRTYVTTNPVNNIDYRQTGIFLFSLVGSETLQDGSGLQIARTDYVYDKYGTTTGHAPLVDRLGITNHGGTYDTTYKSRGNLTDVNRWLNTTGGTVTAYSQYDIAGNVVKTIDPRGFATTMSYTDNYVNGVPSGPTYAYPTSVTNAKGQTATTQYYFNTGLPSVVTDANGTTTSLSYSDPLSHLTQTIRAANRGEPLINQTTINYNYAGRTVAATSDLDTYNDNKVKAEQVYDGLGRLVESRSYESISAYIRTERRYDADERLNQVSNPYRPGLESAQWTTTTYDGLGRVKTVTTPDGAVVTSNYYGNETTVTDQALKVRRSITDGLGRLSQVVEDPNGLAFSTTYSYDLLDNLTSVSQGVQSRSFTYDSFKRLTSATNPESGTVSYQYDANGNLTQKTDARSISTFFAYDELNRVTSKTYSDTTPAVSYFYDASQPASVPVGYNRGFSTGRLTAVTTATTGNYYGYDSLGRVNLSYQRLDGVDYAFSNYAYDKGSLLTSESYPSGRVIGMSYDTAGRIASVTNNGANVASGISYASHGAITSETLGNGLLHQIGYNNRLQPASITLGSVLSITYNYGATNNNGNLLTETITPGSGQTPFVQTFTYDPFNRLQSATESVSGAQTWKQTNGFDRYGNRWIDSLNTTGNVMGPLTSQSDLSATNNRIVKAGYAYDAAGNMTAEPGKTYTFDGENKIATAVVGSTTTSYVYDGEGRRVKKTVGATVTRMVYNAAGELIAEYTGGGSLTKEYVYRGGETIATVEPTNGTEYATADHLGTPRVWTNSAGQVVTGGRHDYLPFGEELFSGIGGRSTGQGYAASTQADGQRKQFTSKERDAETNLDYFLARYHSSSHGRFTSVDPYNIVMETQTVTDARTARSQFLTYLSNPQRWNRYPYTLNNPLLYTDPKGEDVTIYYREGTGSSDSDEGHIFIYVKNDETGESAYFDYYPDKGLTVLGNVTQDRINDHASLTIETDAKQEQAILSGIKEMQEKAPNYEVSLSTLLKGCESTCVSQSANLLRRGGIELSGQLPATVWMNAYRRYSQEALSGTFLLPPPSLKSADYYFGHPAVHPENRDYGRDPRGQARILDKNATNNQRIQFKDGKRVQE